jgi:predicted DNA-binding transcriptional regulator AlpA
MIPDLIRAEAVAKILGTSRSNVYSLAKSGVLPHVAFKTRGDRDTIRFRSVDIESFITGHLREVGAR